MFSSAVSLSSFFGAQSDLACSSKIMLREAFAGVRVNDGRLLSSFVDGMVMVMTDALAVYCCCLFGWVVWLLWYRLQV